MWRSACRKQRHAHRRHKQHLRRPPAHTGPEPDALRLRVAVPLRKRRTGRISLRRQRYRAGDHVGVQRTRSRTGAGRRFRFHQRQRRHADVRSTRTAASRQDRHRTAGNHSADACSHRAGARTGAQGLPAGTRRCARSGRGLQAADPDRFLHQDRPAGCRRRRAARSGRTLPAVLGQASGREGRQRRTGQALSRTGLQLFPGLLLRPAPAY